MTLSFRLLVSLFVYTIVFALPTAAQTKYTWGGGSGDWNVATNWSPNGIPTESDTAVVSAGTVTIVDSTVVAAFKISGLAVLDGNADLTVIDSLIWSGGGTGWDTFRGTGFVTVSSTATLRMTGPTTSYRVSSDRVVVNEGTAVWEGDGSWSGSGRLVNAGELILAFESTDAFGFVFSSLSDALVNRAGGVIRWTGSGEALYVAGMINDGTIRVENGVLQMQGFNATGMTGSGNIEVQANAVFRIGGSTNSLSGEPSISGDGTVEMAAGTLTLVGGFDVQVTRFTAFARLFINGTGTTRTLDMAAGELSGSGDFSVTDELVWSGGTMGGSGTTTLGPSIPVAIGGVNIGVRDTRTLRVEGATTWTGDADFSNGTGAIFENAGTVTSSGAGQRQFFGGTFRNLGTVIHEEGSLMFVSGMDNEGLVRITGGDVTQQGFNATGGTDTGRYEVESGARLAFGGGTRTLTASVVVAGDGTVDLIAGNLTNNATWQPGPLAGSGVGTMDIAANLAASFGKLEVQIDGLGAGTDYDQLVVDGNFSFGDTIVVSVDPGFTPTEGDRFLIIPVTGTISGSLTELELPAGLEAFVTESASGIELVVGTPVSNESADGLPTTFALHGAYPNPFNPQATVAFDVPTAGDVRISLFDILGREVAVLADGQYRPGRFTATIDGGALSSGMYFVRMAAGGSFDQTRQIILLK